MSLGLLLFIFLLVMLAPYFIVPLIFIVIAGSVLSYFYRARMNLGNRDFKEDKLEDEVVRDVVYEEDKSFDPKYENTVMDADFGVEKPDEDNPLDDIPVSVTDENFDTEDKNIVEAEIIEGE